MGRGGLTRCITLQDKRPQGVNAIRSAVHRATLDTTTASAYGLKALMVLDSFRFEQGGMGTSWLGVERDVRLKSRHTGHCDGQKDENASSLIPKKVSSSHR